MIEYELEAGIIVLALIHVGEITFNCESCNTLMQKDLCCSGEAPYPVMIHDEYEFYSCPIKWLSDAVYSWYDEYSYYEIYPNSAPSYDNVNLRYWDCVKIYKSTLNKAEIDKIHKKSNNKGNTDVSLSKLRQGFKKKT
jgi:hypothetical protein